MDHAASPAQVPPNALQRGGRVFVPLRKLGRATPGRSPVFHAVTPYCRMALCQAEPGAGSGWAEPPSERVTCQACLARLARMAA